MQTKIKSFFRNFTKRENITALGLIVVVAGTSLVLAFASASFSRYHNLQAAKEKRHSAYEDELRRLSGLTVNLVPAPDPTADWKAYENTKYGFSLKYPDGWQPPREIFPGRGENFILKISFDEKGIVSEKDTKGFDVFVYSAAKFPGPAGTDNLKRKNENVSFEDCPRFDDITLGQEGYPAKEVDVKADNPCWEETFFYSLTLNGYTLNIVPRTQAGLSTMGQDIIIPLVRTFPEFYDVASTLMFVERGKESIAQAPKKIVRKVVSAPEVRYSTGRRCAEKHDHPRYSKTKGKHMDEDCCPDPDEWPNPRCAYSGGQLGVLRSKPKK